jgi:hypothetical protein
MNRGTESLDSCRAETVPATRSDLIPSDRNLSRSSAKLHVFSLRGAPARGEHLNLAAAIAGFHLFVLNLYKAHFPHSHPSFI